MKLSGWGRYPVVDCEVEHVRRWDRLAELVRGEGTLIARGNGRSYGDAALNPNRTLSMLAMDRMLAFDGATGMLTCEAGVLLSDILATFVPRGWMPPVVPGTASVTVGGMIAADVHGKNHHQDGSFGRHVESLELLPGDGDVLRCSRSHNPAAFFATIGGMGLTGVVVSASFRMKRVETGYLRSETFATADLDATMALFDDSRDWPYSVAWIDSLARGGRMGRSVLTRAAFVDRAALPPRFAAAPFAAGRHATLAVPDVVPSSLLGFSAKAFNALYYGLGRARSGSRLVDHGSYFFPLDRLAEWNRLYGAAGFVQYQCVLPKGESERGLRELLDCVAAAGQGSFLAVLKLLGEEGEGMMSFPMEGYTLALDIPVRPGLAEMMDALDEITHARGGRVYLAKDACSSPSRLSAGYQRLDAFRSIRDSLQGGDSKFASALSERLGL